MHNKAQLQKAAEQISPTSSQEVRRSTPDNENHLNIDYVRHLWENTLHWYDRAETKAQIVLGFNGVFLAFLTGTVYSKPDELRLILSQFSVYTSILLGLMLICLFFSTIVCVNCLWSRMDSSKKLLERINQEKKDNKYSTDFMWFFQHIAVLDKTIFINTLKSMTIDDEIKALGEEIHIVSENVSRKHQNANIGFILSVTTFILFFASALTYFISVSK